MTKPVPIDDTTDPLVVAYVQELFDKLFAFDPERYAVMMEAKESNTPGWSKLFGELLDEMSAAEKAARTYN